MLLADSTSKSFHKFDDCKRTSVKSRTPTNAPKNQRRFEVGEFFVVGEFGKFI